MMGFPPCCAIARSGLQRRERQSSPAMRPLCAIERRFGRWLTARARAAAQSERCAGSYSGVLGGELGARLPDPRRETPAPGLDTRADLIDQRNLDEDAGVVKGL